MSPYGGDKEARTLDPLLAKQVLSQLSYTPTLSRFGLAYHFEVPFYRALKIEQYRMLSQQPVRPTKETSLSWPSDSLERR